MAAAGEVLGSAGARGTAGEHQREQRRAVGAQARRVEASRQEVARGGGSPRRAGGAALHSGGETELRSWRKGKRTQTKFLKFLGTKL